MKFGWKLFLAFCLPLLCAFGSFYLSDLVKEWQKSQSGFSFDLSDGGYYGDFDLSDFFSVAGFGLVILSFFLPLLILHRKQQNQPMKLFD